MNGWDVFEAHPGLWDARVDALPGTIDNLTAPTHAELHAQFGLGDPTPRVRQLCKLFVGEPWMTQSGKWRAKPKSHGLKGQQRRSGPSIVRDWTDSRGGWTVVLCKTTAGREISSSRHGVWQR